MGPPLLIGAGIGAATSLAMGKSPFMGALLGGATGGAFGGAGGFGSGFGLGEGGFLSGLHGVAPEAVSLGTGGYANLGANALGNGTQGLNGDAGSIITISTTWDEIPDGLVVANVSTTTVTASVPETTFIGNSWGTITITGTVTGT